MEETTELSRYVKYLTSQAFISSVVVIAVASALLWVIKQYLIKKVAYSGKDEQHKNTFIGMIFNVLQYLVILVATVIVLQLNGVNVGSILAGLGIVATIIGLALQDTLKDIIAGINIYNNNFYKVGDMVKWNGEECDVKYFSARVTKFQSVITNSTYTVCNSQITSIEKIKDTKTAIFMFKFADDREIIDKALIKAMDKTKDDCKYIKKANYIGPAMINDSGVGYVIVYTCPAHKDIMARAQLVQNVFDECKKAGVRPTFNRDYLT